MGWFRPKVVVISFIDDETGETFATTKMPAADVPESFAVDTTLHLGDTDWSVVRAQPLTRDEFTRSGSLTLWLRRVLKVDPRSILFSLPSICDRLPEVGPGALREDELLMAEDDWRQLELVSRELAPQAEAQIQAIRRIHDEEWTGSGWRGIHVRSEPDPPITAALTRADLARAFGGISFHGVGYHGVAGPIESGFSFTAADGLRGYGVEADGRVTVLGIAQDNEGPPPDRSIGALAQIAREFDLLLANWCRCALVEPDNALFRQLLRDGAQAADAE